jgi:hypothetical protein
MVLCFKTEVSKPVKEILIVVSTYNRLDLTALTLTSVKQNKSSISDVLVLDDASSTYDAKWLDRWTFPVERRETTVGVGRAARARYERFLLSDYRYLCALDNDILVAENFDLQLLNLWHRVDNAELTVVTGYRSVTQKVILDLGDYHEVDGVGGACHFVDRATAQKVVEKMEPTWPHAWDRAISKVYAKKFAPARSLVEHLGVYGSGVNGASNDIALNPQVSFRMQAL